MPDIVKICKIHGQLIENQVYRWSNRIRCKICRINHAEIVQENFRKFVEKSSDTDIVYTCKHHGSLTKFQLVTRRKECRACFRDKQKRWALKNPEKLKKQIKNREKNPNFKNNQRSSRLKSKYGISLKDYKEMFEKQNGKCAICGKEEIDTDRRTGKIKNLATDHCHKTGKVRGLLCHKHNLMLGNAQDSEEMLNSGIDYLRRHKTAE